MTTLNTIACGQCSFFDENAMLRAGRVTRLGWCAANSKYAATDLPGKPAPRGAQRVAEGELPRPVIKTRAQIEVGCAKAKPRAAQAPLTKAALLAKAQGRR